MIIYMDENKQKSDFAVKIVMKYLELIGCKPQDVQRDKSFGDCEGCDIIAEINGRRAKIEVKGSTKEEGIPDCYGKSFNDDKTVKADYFYIVRLEKDKESQDLPFKAKRVEILNKEEIDRYAENHQWIKRLRTRRLDSDLAKKKVGKIIEEKELPKVFV